MAELEDEHRFPCPSCSSEVAILIDPSGGRRQTFTPYHLPIQPECRRARRLSETFRLLIARTSRQIGTGFTWDCEVCCRPMVIRLVLSDGGLQQFAAEQES